MLIKNIEKYNSDFHRKKFDKFLPETSTNSDYFLDSNAFVGTFGNSDVVFLKIRNKFYEEVNGLKTIPWGENLENTYFIDIGDKELKLLKENYNLDFIRESSYDFIYNKEEFLINAKKDRKYKNFIKKNNFKIYYDYEKEKVREMFLKWILELEHRGEKPSKTWEDIENIWLNGDQYKLKTFFLEIENKLVGFAFGLKYSILEESDYMFLYNYSLREPRDVHYFLKVLRAENLESEILMDSVYALDNSIAKYKLENFKPTEIKKVYTVKTGVRK